MAAERQKPAQLDWRRPAWGWTLVAFAVGGPLNPLALGVFIVSSGGNSADGAAGAYCLAAAAASAAMIVAIVSWLAPQPSLPRTAQALGLSVVAVAVGLAISAGLTLGNNSPVAPPLDERINLALAVLMLSILAGFAIAASSMAAFRLIALRRKRRRTGFRSRVIRPREIGGEAHAQPSPAEPSSPLSPANPAWLKPAI